MNSGYPGNPLCVHAPAKVNLFLELLRRRDDGFHEIETVISPVSIYDTLCFRHSTGENSNSPVQLEIAKSVNSNGDDIPVGRSNLVFQALELLRQNKSGQKKSNACIRGVTVTITKRIPSAAGLGGASSDAAAALIGGNQFWNLGLDNATLSGLAAQVGSDVPVFLNGHSALCTGRGEIVKSVACPGGLPLVIAMPPEGLSTAKVYSNSKIPNQPVSASGLLDTLKTRSVPGIARALFNRMESFAAAMTVWVERLRFEFARLNCHGHQMTGSGSAYFGLFPGKRAARIAAKRLSNRLPEVTIFQCHTLGI